MNSLLERMEEVLRHRGWSARQWARLAGLSELSHVSGLMRVLRKTGRPYAGDLNTWARLAQAAGVSLDWLVFGRGEALGIPVARDRYPSRALVLAFARSTGFSENSIRQVAEIEALPRDPGKEYWLTELLQAERLEKALTSPSPRAPKTR